jgi:hypothetical protein
MSSRKLTPFVLVAALLATGCGSDSAAPSEPTAQAATDVLSVSPQGGATNVDPNGPFSFQFNGAMMPGMEQYVDLHRGEVTGPIHPISCAWSPDYTTLTCTPTPPLDSGTWYTLHVGGGMMGADGVPIHMDPDTWMGGWAQEGTPMGPGMMDGSMMGLTHAGDPWTMMGPGWQNANGTYGMVFPFQTR